MSIELIWVAKYGKKKKRGKTTISGHSRRPVPVQVNMYRYSLGSGHFLANLYQYRLELYRYSLGFGRFWPTYTGTGQCCTGTPCFVLTSVHTLAITFSFRILFE